MHTDTVCSDSTHVLQVNVMHHNRNQPYWPALKRNPHPSWPDEQCIKQRDEAEKKKQSFYYNWCHGARPLSQHQPGGIIRTKLEHQKSWTAPSVVTTEHVMPRSYIIQVQKGQHPCRISAPSRRYLLHCQMESHYLSYLFASVCVVTPVSECRLVPFFPLFQKVNLNHMNGSREGGRVPLNVENCYVFQYANCDLTEIDWRFNVLYWFLMKIKLFTFHDVLNVLLWIAKEYHCCLQNVWSVYFIKKG